MLGARTLNAHIYIYIYTVKDIVALWVDVCGEQLWGGEKGGIMSRGRY